MKRFDNLRAHPLLGLVLLSIVLTGCPPPVEDDPNQNTTVTDIEGNIYKTVTIGTQVWMAENLKTTKYNDGTSIPLVTDNNAWIKLSTPGFCWYNNDAVTNKSTFGALYNWYTVNTSKLCPTGWHIPNDTEWGILTTYLGGEAVAGGKLKETGTIHWVSPNTGATNETGFTSLPSGYRDGIGEFVNIGTFCYFLCNTEINARDAWSRYIYFDITAVQRIGTWKYCGFSARCLKD